MSDAESKAQSVFRRVRALWAGAMAAGGSVESKLVAMGLVGCALFLSLVATLFLVQRGLGNAQRNLGGTALPTEQALGRLETLLGAAFERQARIASARNLDELADVRDRSTLERAFSGTGALLAVGDQGELRELMPQLPDHVRAFLDADRELFQTVERRHTLRAALETEFSQIDVDLAALIQAANALSGVQQLAHVHLLRQLAAEAAAGSPSRRLVSEVVSGGVQARMQDVADLAQAVMALGRLAARTGVAKTDDVLNAITANEIPQNRSQIERLLSTLAHSADSGSDVTDRVRDITRQFHALSPRISGESRTDSLVSLRRRVLAEARNARAILQDCARTADRLTGDLAALGAASTRQADAALASSASTARWSRWGSLMISVLGLLACFGAGLRIRDSVQVLRTTNRELADLRDNLEQKVERRTLQLASSREQYRLLVETTKTIPFDLALDGLCFRYVGPQVVSMLGFSAATCLQPRFFEQHLHPDDRERVFAALAAPGEHVDIDLRIQRPDGAHGWFRLIGTPVGLAEVADTSVSADPDASARITSSGPRSLRGVLLDETQTRELELQLRQAQKLESVGRLASGVAHEINTPVQFVNDNVHFLRDAFADLTTLIVRYRELCGASGGSGAPFEVAAEIAAAEEAADLTFVLERAPLAIERSIDGLSRIAEIVRSMKEFAHPDQKEMKAIDLNKALANTLTIARNEYKYVADVETEPGDIPAVLCHAGEVNQVFLNLLVNAAHAIADVVKGGEDRGRIRIATSRDGEDVVVSISDTGCGIPEHIRDRIFDPFFTTKEVGKGTGQGLAIARSVVVDKHGGKIHVDSEVGRGTTFTVRLPIAGKPQGRREEVAV